MHLRTAKQIKIWDLLSGECIQTLAGHTDEIWCLKVLDGLTWVMKKHLVIFEFYKWFDFGDKWLG